MIKKQLNGQTEQNSEGTSRNAQALASQKEKVQKLKDRDFIMSILNDCVTIDEENKMKFICIDEVREKFNKIFGDKK